MNMDGIPQHPGQPLDPNLAEGFTAKAGQPLAEGSVLAADEAVVEAFKTVFDPEIPVDIYELGLIYDFTISERGDIKVDMSLTAPGCPVAGELPQWVADAAAKVDGIGEAEVTLVWEPAWSPERMSEDAKLALGIMDD
jgi:FeS assembly SUF system protein